MSFSPEESAGVFFGVDKSPAPLVFAWLKYNQDNVVKTCGEERSMSGRHVRAQYDEGAMGRVIVGLWSAMGVFGIF